MTGRVEAEFQRYLARVYDSPIGETQKSELRYAYFAGVYWMQNVFPDELDPGDMETGADIAKMQAVYDEIMAMVAARIASIPTAGNA